MKILFWLSFSLISIIYFGYPLFIFILTLFKKKPVNKGEITPLVSLIIPAHNEEQTINEKIKNSLALNYPKNKLEIIIVSDHSTDKTDDIVRQYNKQNIKLIVQNKRRGKMAGLNRAVPCARGEIIFFSDANTIYHKDAVKNLINNFNDKNIGCVSGSSRFVLKENSNVELGGSLYMKYERSLWNMESRLQSLLVVDGAIYGLRKSLFSPVDEALADDFINPLRASAKGYGVIYEPDARATEKIANRTTEELERRIRVTSQGLLAFVNMLKVILSCGYLRIVQYTLHKFLRWLAPLFLIVLFISNMSLLKFGYYRVIFILQVVFYLSAVLGYWLQEKKSKIRLFYIPFYFCLLNTASLSGLFLALSGRQRGVWEKAETTR